MQVWNSHKIRPSKNAVSPHGRPYIMYNLPHLYGVTDHLKNVDQNLIDLCKQECVHPNHPCDEDVFNIAHEIMLENGWRMPNDASEGSYLYKQLREWFLLLVN